MSNGNQQQDLSGRRYEISHDEAQLIAAYLARHPYMEVFRLIGILQNLRPLSIQANVPAPAPASTAVVKPEPVPADRPGSNGGAGVQA